MIKLPAASVKAPFDFGGLFSFGSSLLNLGYQIHRDKSLTGAQKEMNAFNASQAALQRFFESEQADIARQWQEEQYNKYNSPSALVRQYQEAGINPALMFGGQTLPAATSTSVPSGSSASGSSVVGGDVAGALMQLSMLEQDLLDRKSNRRLQQAEANRAYEDARDTRVDVDQKEFDLELDRETRDALKQSRELNAQHIQASIDVLTSNRVWNEARTVLTNHQISETDANIALKVSEIALNEVSKDLKELGKFDAIWRANFIQRAHCTPEYAQKAYDALSGTLTDVLGMFLPTSKVTELIGKGGEIVGGMRKVSKVGNVLK